MSSPVPVVMEGWSWSATLIALLNLIVGSGIVAAIVKVWPEMKKISVDRETARAKLRSTDMDALRAEVREVKAQIAEAVSVAHTAEMKLVYAISAVQLLAARVRADNPDDPTLKQASELLAAATTGEMPSWAGKLTRGMDQIRGERP